MRHILVVALALAVAAAPARADEPSAASALGAPDEVVPGMLAYGMPAIPQSVLDEVAPYLDPRAASFHTWAEDGGMLIGTRFAETDQIHRVSQPLGARFQLTFEREPVRDARWAAWRGRPGFFFLMDVGGAEAFQLFHFDIGTGRKTALTEPPARVVGLIVSNDRRHLAFASTARNGVDYDVYVLDLERDDAPRQIYEGQGHWEPQDWSPSGTEVLVLRFVSVTEASVFRIDTATGKATEVAAPQRGRKPEPVFTGDARYAADGKGVYLVTNRWGEFRELAYVPVDTDKPERLSQDIPWDIEKVEVDPAGRRLALVVNEGGRSRLVVWGLPERKAEALPELPPGLIGSLGFDDPGERLALTIVSATRPGDVYVLGLSGDGGRGLVRWTESEVGGLPTEEFVEPELLDYPTFDKVGRKPRLIPAFYFRPRGAGPFPAIVLIHGGPESQWRPQFSAWIQHWVKDLQIAVIAPNVRGSSGYGKTWLLLDNGRRREDSVRDIGALLDWIGTREELDAGRVAVYGGSYGGYMVLASLARFADRLKAGAEIVGISNFVTFLERTQAYRRDLRRAEYGDERDEDMRKFLVSISPTELVSKIRSPLLVAQGKNDPRVPVGESEQIVAAVHGQGVPVWYMRAEDEGHGFAKKKNRDYYAAALSAFWREHLLR